MMISRRVAPILVLAIGIGLSGCEGMKGGGSKKGKANKGPYSIPTPPGAGWKRMGEGASVSFIKVNDAADDDVVTLFVGTEDTAKQFATIEDVAAHLQGRGSASMKTVEMDVIAGVQGVRFVAYQEDTGSGGTADERESLGLPAREAGMRFYVRTRGFVIPDPKKPSRLIKLGISRTSFHGYIGTHFEAIGDSFVESFLTENGIGGGISDGGFADPVRLNGIGGGDRGLPRGVVPPDDRPPDFDL